MDFKEKEYRKLKFALALRTAMVNFNKAENISDAEIFESISFRDLETNSGIPHPSIVQIVNGKKNASWTTIDALLEGLEISLTQFGNIYDSLSQQQVMQYKKDLDRKKAQRNAAKKLPQKRKK